MNKSIGFIGSGNMAGAIINGMIKSNLIVPENIIASAKSEKTLKKIEENYKIKTTLDNKEVSRQSDFLILAVKPHMYGEILNEIKNDIKVGAVIISIGAGITLNYMKKALGENRLIVKAMPNTPAMVGEGMTALSFCKDTPEDIKEEVQGIFNSFGKSEILNEDLIDGFTALCGSSPAYVYIMIEAMADAAVLEGIPRNQAYKMAAQAVLGSAKMILDTGIHPGELKDNVCSPHGTTIEAVAKLEQTGFRTSIIEAMRACANKSREMGK